MKKIVSFYIFTAICISIVGLFTACGSTKNKNEESISEYRSDLYYGENERFKVELITGYRENPFEIDGVSGTKCDYTLITVTPKHSITDKSFEIIVNNNDEQKMSGTALKHPYKDSYSFEYMAKTKADKITVTLSDGNSDSSVDLQNVRKESEIGGEQALEKAFESLEECIRPYMNKDKFNGEIYLRYIKNPIGDDGKYFWYVAFVPAAQPDKSIAALIDVITGEVKATRK